MKPTQEKRKKNRLKSNEIFEDPVLSEALQEFPDLDFISEQIVEFSYAKNWKNSYGQNLYVCTQSATLSLSHLPRRRWR